MARTVLTITNADPKGTTKPAASAADNTNGNSLPYNDGHVVVEVNNPTGGALSVTFGIPGSVGGFGITQDTVSVAAGATKLFGPFAPAVFNQADGTVAIDAAAGLTLNAIHVG